MRKCLEAGVLKALTVLITHHKQAVRKEACWAISNITAGTPLEVEWCLDQGVFEKLVHCLVVDNTEVKKEAIWALSNALNFASES